jgi:hypothetical protein
MNAGVAPVCTWKFADIFVKLLATLPNFFFENSSSYSLRVLNLFQWRCGRLESSYFS